MTPFWLPPILAVVLAAIYLYAEEGRWSLKLLIAGALVLAFFLQRHGGVTGAIGLVLHVGVCIYVLLWLGIRR